MRNPVHPPKRPIHKPGPRPKGVKPPVGAGTHVAKHRLAHLRAKDIRAIGDAYREAFAKGPTTPHDIPKIMRRIDPPSAKLTE